MSEGLISALHGAFLLARGRAEGIALIVPLRTGETTLPLENLAARSFWAMALALPAFLSLHLMGWATAGLPPHPGRELALDLLATSVGWLGFAALSHELAGMLGRTTLWPRYLTVWNWCNLVQYLLLVLTTLPSLLGLPPLLAETTWLVGLIWALWLEWYATRLALALPPTQAAAFVGLDFALGLLLAGLIG
jgi:hypothetical protein